MRVRFLGKPREIMGREVELEVSEIKLRDLLEKFPKEVRDLVTDGEKLKMIVLINGVSAESKGGLDALIFPEDELLIMPEISGG